ncbi:hypothetical protein ACFSHP_26675 [Novosphingobium panipatense]
MRAAPDAPPGRAGKLADRRRSRLARESIDEADAPAGFGDRETQHGGCLALTLIAAGAMRLLGRDIAALDGSDPIPA